MMNENTKLIYDTLDAVKSIKKKYPWIPKAIIRRVLYGNDLYMYKVGIIKYIPKLTNWCPKK